MISEENYLVRHVSHLLDEMGIRPPNFDQWMNMICDGLHGWKYYIKYHVMRPNAPMLLFFAFDRIELVPSAALSLFDH